MTDYKKLDVRGLQALLQTKFGDVSDVPSVLPEIRDLLPKALVRYALDPKGYNFVSEQHVWKARVPSSVTRTFKAFFIDMYSGQDPMAIRTSFASHDEEKSFLHRDGSFRDETMRARLIHEALSTGLYNHTELQINEDGILTVSGAMRGYLQGELGLISDEAMFTYIGDCLEGPNAQRDRQREMSAMIADMRKILQTKAPTNSGPTRWNPTSLFCLTA